MPPSLMPSDTLPPATPPKRPPLDPDQQSPTGVAEATDEDSAFDDMFTCVDALTKPHPSIVRKEFTGDSRAVAAQVGLVLGAFGLGGLADPDVSEEEAMQNTLQTLVSRNAHTLSPDVMRVPKGVARNLHQHPNTDKVPAILRAAQFVINDAQQDAIAQVKAIAFASPDTLAVKAVLQSLETIAASMAAGVHMEPARKLTEDLNRLIAKRQSSDADLLLGGRVFLESPSPMPPGAYARGTEGLFAELATIRAQFNARHIPDAVSPAAKGSILQKLPEHMIGEAKMSERMYDRHNDESPPPDPDDRAATYLWFSTHFDLLQARLVAIADDLDLIHFNKLTARKGKSAAPTATQSKAPAAAQAQAQAANKPKGTSDKETKHHAKYASRRTPADETCWKCGKPHAPEECEHDDKVCTICFDAGHLRRSCPTKKAGNGGAQSSHA